MTRTITLLVVGCAILVCGVLAVLFRKPMIRVIKASVAFLRRQGDKAKAKAEKVARQVKEKVNCALDERLIEKTLRK